jgi:predicted Zn-dependent protease
MADLNKLVAEQASVMGVGAVSVVPEDDGYASTDGKAIFVNPSFMSRIESSAGEAGLRFVLAHELGHIHQGMAGGHSGELDADKFGARSVAAMGYDFHSISQVMKHLPNETTKTHPGAGTREASARAAYEGHRSTELAAEAPARRAVPVER